MKNIHKILGLSAVIITGMMTLESCKKTGLRPSLYHFFQQKYPYRYSRI